MIRRYEKHSTNNRQLMECLVGLKNLRSEKKSLKESYTRGNKFESVSPRRIRSLESMYNKDCNELVCDNQCILADCMEIPQVRKCLKCVCDDNGCVYEDCNEAEFDNALDDAIECLGWLVMPVKVRC